MRHVVRDPYEGVDWGSDLRVKASLHVHTKQPDASRGVAQAIDRYHQLGYKALAITDHDSRKEGVDGTVSRTSLDAEPQTTWPWTDYGRDPDTLGMIAVQGNEPSWSHHMGSYFNDTWRDEDLGPGGLYATLGASVTGIINLIGQRGGLMQMAHPGRDPLTDETYVALHETYPHLIGHEVFNRNNLYPEDKARWDRLLTLSRSLGLVLPIWGWAVDDSHGLYDNGYSYHVHLLPEQTDTALRASLEGGSYWFVNDPAGAGSDLRHVRPGSPSFFTAAPIIHNIDVRADRITVYATGHSGISWVSDGAVVATGATIHLDNPSLGGYVRAEMVEAGGFGARTLTQPWLLADGAAPVAGGWSVTRGGLLVPAVMGVVREGVVTET